MTDDDFRQIVLGFAGVVEGSHQRHADFRLGGKIFASLGAGGAERGMVKLSPDQQRTYGELFPSVFKPCAGAWGERGYTELDLAKVTKKVAREVVELALAEMRLSAVGKETRVRKPTRPRKESQGKGKRKKES